MGEYGGDGGFSHDGEFGDSCTGYGCDCDERHYGYRGGGGGGSGGSNGGIYAVFILALILGYGINELLGAIIMIGLIIYIAFTK